MDRDIQSADTLSANYLYRSKAYRQILILPTNLPINRITLGNFSSTYSQPAPLAFPAQQHPTAPLPPLHRKELLLCRY